MLTTLERELIELEYAYELSHHWCPEESEGYLQRLTALRAQLQQVAA